MSTSDSSSTRTTTTSTTVTGWERVRPNGGWLPIAAGAAGLALLGLINGIPLRTSIESELTTRSNAKLAEAGATGMRVSFDGSGRDGVLTGTLPAGTDAAKLLDVIRGVDGVREVSYQGSSSGATATPSASASSPPASSSSAPALALPSVKAEAKEGTVTLTGSVPTQAASDALVAAATAVYGADKVTNQLSIDATVSDAGLSGLGAVLTALGKDSAAVASLAAGTLTLSGSVGSVEAQKAADDAAAAVTGDAAKVADQLTVAAPVPAPSPSPTPAVTSSNSGSGVQASLDALPSVLFPSASNSVSPTYAAIIKQAAEILRANPAVRVRLDGHTDDLGTSRVNDELSAARAITVRNYLISLGISGDRITYSYHGYADPKVANKDDAARAQNRRVTFTVI